MILLEMFTYPFIVRAFIVGILVSVCKSGDVLLLPDRFHGGLGRGRGIFEPDAPECGGAARGDMLNG